MANRYRNPRVRQIIALARAGRDGVEMGARLGISSQRIYQLLEADGLRIGGLRRVRCCVCRAVLTHTRAKLETALCGERACRNELDRRRRAALPARPHRRCANCGREMRTYQQPGDTSIHFCHKPNACIAAYHRHRWHKDPAYEARALALNLTYQRRRSE